MCCPSILVSLYGACTAPTCRLAHPSSVSVSEKLNCSKPSRSYIPKSTHCTEAADHITAVVSSPCASPAIISIGCASLPNVYTADASKLVVSKPLSHLILTELSQYHLKLPSDMHSCPCACQWLTRCVGPPVHLFAVNRKLG